MRMFIPEALYVLENLDNWVRYVVFVRKWYKTQIMHDKHVYSYTMMNICSNYLSESYYTIFSTLTEHTNGDGDYTSSLLGILVMQDVHLGLLVALLPALAGRKSAALAKANSGAVHGVLGGHDDANTSNPGTKYLIQSLLYDGENNFIVIG